MNKLKKFIKNNIKIFLISITFFVFFLFLDKLVHMFFHYDANILSFNYHVDEFLDKIILLTFITTIIYLSKRESDKKMLVKDFLKMSEEKQKIVYNSASDYIYIYNKEGELLFLNDKAIELYNLSKQNSLIINTNNYETNNNEIELRDIINDIYETGKEYNNIEGSIIVNDEVKWFDVKFTPIKNTDGTVNSVICISKNITEVKLVNQALFILKQAVENSGEIIFMTDIEGYFIYVNPMFTKTYGYEKEDILLKQTPRNIKSGLMNNEYYKDIWASLLNKQRFNGEIINKTKDGQYINVEISASPIIDENNKLIGYLAIQKDITKKKEIEKELQLSEEKYRNIFETLLVGIYRIRASDGSIILANQRCYDMLSYCKEDFAEDYFPNVMNLFEDHETQETVLGKIKQDGSLTNYEIKLKKKDGSIFYALTNNRYYPDKDIIEGTILDITDKKIAEKSLALSEEKYRNLFETSLVGIFKTKVSDGRVLMANHSLLKIIDYSQEDLLDSMGVHFLYKNISDRNYLVKEIKEKGFINNFETILVKKNNAVIHVLISARYYADEDLIEGTLIDITLRKQFYNALLKSEEKFRNLFESALVGIYKIRFSDGTILVANQKCYEILGYSKVDFLDSSPSDKILYNNLSQRRTLTKLLIKKGYANIELQLKCKNGIVITVLSNNKYYPDDDIIEGTIVDVTRMKQIENELILAKQTAEEASKMKSSFLAAVSHELRTPLNGIIGFSDIILSYNLTNDKIIEYTKTIYESGEILLKLIDNILEITRIEAGKISIYKEYINIKKLIESVTSLNIFQNSGKKISFEVKIDPQLPEEIYTDQTKLKSILINILGNAFKFIHEGTIRFILKKTKKYPILFLIKDTGIGISQEQLKKIFEPFYQIDGYISRSYGGSGLGLSISQNYINSLNGKLWVKSRLNKGTIFCFYIDIDDKKENDKWK